MADPVYIPIGPDFHWSEGPALELPVGTFIVETDGRPIILVKSNPSIANREWMLCDGREVPLDRYPDFAILGDTFGVASPGFVRLPDFQEDRPGAAIRVNRGRIEVLVEV